MPVTGVLFDLGGTLFSYERRREMAGALMQAAADLGIEPDPTVVARAWRQAGDAVMRRYATLEYFLHSDLFRDTLVAFANDFGRDVDAAVAERFARAQRRAVIEHLPLRSDCHETLRRLKARGLYLAIVSNIDDDYLHPLIEKHGLDRWLDHWTSSEEARSCKPHAGIYRVALGKAGLTASQVLFVGDSLHHDVAGASALGMRSVRIVEAGVSAPLTSGLAVTAQPDFEIAALRELPEIVDRCNADAG